MKETFMGRHFAYWAAVDRAMEKHGIKTACQLDKALEKPKPDPMVSRVEIRDSKNTDRVLGSVPRPSGNSPRLDGGDWYNIAVARRISISAMPYDPCADLSVSYVRFGFRDINWTVVLVADASLELLSQIEDFRFPGEDAEQAHVRRMYAR